MDLKKIMGHGSKFDRQMAIEEEISKSLDDPDFKLSVLFKQFARGGNLVIRALNEKLANHETLRDFIFKVEPQAGHPDGIFLVPLGDKEHVMDPASGQRVGVTGDMKSAMKDAYEESGNPDDHYIKFAKLRIDEHGCVKCSLPVAQTIIINHTDQLFRKNKNKAARELSLAEYEALKSQAKPSHGRKDK